jgi:Fic family protein
VSFRPQYTITPHLLSRVEQVAALRERILTGAVQVPWIPALQKDSRVRNAHSSTAIEGNPLTLEQVRAIALDLLRPLMKAGLVRRIGTKKTGRYVLT